MSSNQRPTKVRVFSSQSRDPASLRRRTDRAADGQAPADTSAAPGLARDAASGVGANASANAPANASANQGLGKGAYIGFGMLFLIGAAAGGAVLSLLGMGAG